MQLTPTRRWSPRHLFECLTDLAGDPLVLGEQPRARILAVEKLKRRDEELGVTLAPQEVSVQGLPANGGTGITTDTDFSWTQFTGGLHVVSFIPTVATNPAFFVFTTEATTKIPDLSAQGLGLPSGGAGYGWGIIAIAPWASMDDFAGGYAVYPTATSTTCYQSISVGRTFTTE